MPSILKPKPEDDFPLVGVYRFSALVMIVLGKGLF